MKLKKAYKYLKDDLNTIEQALNKAIQAEHPILREASTQLLKAGGKRIRPVFVLLASQMGHFDIKQVEKVAVSLELIHMATLVHDDVIDDAELRRGQPTIKKIYGNRVAMYTGDYILARALEHIATLQDARIHNLLSHTIVEVCLGEIEQIKDQYNWNQQLRHYLRRIKRKTALLIATSCKLGAIVGGTSGKIAHQLYKYGYYIGMSYQIIDDILDFTSTAKELGKPTGNDLLQGHITLPTLFAMKNETFNCQLKEMFTNVDQLSDEHFEQLLNMLKNSDAINCSYKVSNWYLEKALKALEPIPNIKAKKILQMIAKYIGERRS